MRDKEGCSSGFCTLLPAFAAAAAAPSVDDDDYDEDGTTGNAGIDGGHTSVAIMSEAAIPPIRIFLQQCVKTSLVALSCHEQPALENPQIARCIPARGRQTKGATLSALFFFI